MKRFPVLILLIVLAALAAGCAARAGQQAVGAPGGAPTAVPTATPRPQVVEDFAAEPADWSEPLVISGDAKAMEISTIANVMRFTTQKTETYAYKFYGKENFEDVAVEAEIANSGTTTNGIALVCRASDSGWYEFRISSGGTYEFFRYDQQVKDQGGNPYKLLDSGGSQLILTGQKTNRIKLICQDRELKVFINDAELKPSHGAVEEGTYLTGKVGLGVMSFALTPVTVDFERVLISKQ